eukprot:GHVO01039841.1.p1 GENE.GHVO01039841.1~~GHVO01039841.1.p1  ORF type:complete len:263 (-),score=54.29 GHVO01039841.1:14-802(-)
MEAETEGASADLTTPPTATTPANDTSITIPPSTIPPSTIPPSTIPPSTIPPSTIPPSTDDDGRSRTTAVLGSMGPTEDYGEEQNQDQIETVDPAKYLLFESGQKPACVGDFIKEHDLHHGDIVAFDDYRDSDSYIVVEKEGLKTWQANVDDLDSEYLTIPKSVNLLDRDALTRFSQIIKHRPAVTIHLGPDDKYARALFDDDKVPFNWKFSLYYEEGTLKRVRLWTPELDGWTDLGDVNKINKAWMDDTREWIKQHACRGAV